MMRNRPTTDTLCPAIKHICTQYPLLISVARAIEMAGGSVYIVGGWVRDVLLGMRTEDIDIEVSGLSFSDLQKLLAQYGAVETMGISYGILKLRGVPIDWSVPRRDSTGRHPEVTLLETVSLREALERRDLTMNAMAVSFPNGLLHDPFGGWDDMVQGRLRAPNIARFVEDPLRLYRVMQMISRYQMYPDEMLQSACASMSLQGIARERIRAEFEKMFMRTDTPSAGLRWLVQIGRMKDILPEVDLLVSVPQDVRWHPEGDVFEHTMQTLDAAASIARRECLDRHHRMVLLGAALTHDLGKATTTSMHDGRIRSRGHAIASVAPAKRLLDAIMGGKKSVHEIVVLVRWHMEPNLFVVNTASLSAYKRLAARLAPHATIWLLSLLAEADARGRNAHDSTPLAAAGNKVDTFRSQAALAGVLYAAESPMITGKDLCAIGIPPGQRMGRLLDHAYRLQLMHIGITKKTLLDLLAGLSDA